VASGNPNIPSWIGDVAFRWLLSATGENDKCARQLRSSVGIAVFVGQTADKANWVEVGRCDERFGRGPAMPRSLRRPVESVLL
jgi:hypothetical protein